MGALRPVIRWSQPSLPSPGIGNSVQLYGNDSINILYAMKPPQNSGYPKLGWASLVVIHIHVLGGTHAEDTLPDVALQVSVIIALKNNRSWSTPCLKILVLMTYIPNYSSCLVFWKKYPTLVFWVTYIFQFSKLLPGVVFPTSSWNHTISWGDKKQITHSRVPPAPPDSHGPHKLGCHSRW